VHDRCDVGLGEHLSSDERIETNLRRPIHSNNQQVFSTLCESTVCVVSCVVSLCLQLYEHAPNSQCDFLTTMATYSTHSAQPSTCRRRMIGHGCMRMSRAKALRARHIRRLHTEEPTSAAVNQPRQSTASGLKHAPHSDVSGWVDSETRWSDGTELHSKLNIQHGSRSSRTNSSQARIDIRSPPLIEFAIHNRHSLCASIRHKLSDFTNHKI
jgi:hypothetical protein